MSDYTGRKGAHEGLNPGQKTKRNTYNYAIPTFSTSDLENGNGPHLREGAEYLLEFLK